MYGATADAEEIAFLEGFHDIPSQAELRRISRTALYVAAFESDQGSPRQRVIDYVISCKERLDTQKQRSSVCRLGNRPLWDCD